MPPGTRFTMERLVLLVIAVIGLHTAFVLYMADIRRVDPKSETVRTPPGAAPAPTVLKPSVDTDLRASVAPPAAGDPSTLATKRVGQVTSRTPRVNPIAHSPVKDRRRPPAHDSAKTVPAYSLRASSKTKGFKKAFGDTIVVYTTDISRPARAVMVASPSASGDSYHPKPKKSFVAKLQ